MLEFTHITDFKVLNGEGGVIVLGLADNGWIYQYDGDKGVWSRLSKTHPHLIQLTGDVMIEPEVEVTAAEPVEAVPEPVPEPIVEPVVEPTVVPIVEPVVEQNPNT